MKKLICVFLSMVMVLSLCGAALAVQPTDEVVWRNEGGFLIKETVDEYGQIVREFSRESTALRSAEGMNNEDLETLLLGLGMGQVFIDNLTPQAREAYRTGLKIVTTTTYSKRNENGEVTYLPEDVALREIEAMELADSAQGKERDSHPEDFDYMRIVCTAVQMTGAIYLYSADAEWLKMPDWRSVDSLGVSAQNTTIDLNTANGYYGYDAIGPVPPQGGHHVESVDSESIKDAALGLWDGAGCSFPLPKDYSSGITICTNKNFFAHFEIAGERHNPGIATPFDVRATYDHSRTILKLNPSLSMDSSGKIAGAIAIGFGKVHDIYSSRLTCHYEPDEELN